MLERRERKQNVLLQFTLGAGQSSEFVIHEENGSRNVQVLTRVKQVLIRSLSMVVLSM